MELYPDPDTLGVRIQRLFGTDIPNPVHRCLANQLLSGGLLGLITTNYDLAFEACLSEDRRCFTVFDESTHDAFRAATSSGRRQHLLFKIHGTAKKGLEHTLVYKLQQEGLLEPWKRSLLVELVEARVVMILGYSGRDFDICPILAEEASPFEIIWLQRSSHLAPAALRVLRKCSGLLLMGDLIQLLRMVFEPGLTATPCSVGFDAAAHFDPKVSFDWRLAVFNRLACGRYGLPGLESLPVDDLRTRRLRAAMYGHVGRYRDSIRENEQILQSVQLDDMERARYMLGVACGWFIYGAHLRGWRLLRHAERWIHSRPGLSAILRSQVSQARIMMVMRLAQIVRWLPRWIGSERLLKQIHAKYRDTYEETLTSLERDGAWDDLQALQHNAERVGMARHDRLPLPALHGYRSLGLLSLDAIAATRDRLREPPYWLGAEREAAGRSAIEQAELYGWQHELWKLHWLLFWRGDWKRPLTRLGHLRQWWRPFCRTQYAPTGRLFQVLVNLLPQEAVAAEAMGRSRIEMHGEPPR
jgi:hypothetical protein